MQDLELALKATADPTRTRILKLLEAGGLCVCQVQAVMGLAPSTISKHLSTLKLAGLVEDRRNGKWVEYRLAVCSRNPHAEPLLKLLEEQLARDPVVVADRKRMRTIKAIPMERLCSLPAARVPVPTRPKPRRPRVRA